MRGSTSVLNWFVCSAVAAFLLSYVTTAETQKQDEPDAGQILNRMAETYAGCKSYRDSGVAKTVFIETLGSRTVEKPFTTAFVRPDRFRFEYKEKRSTPRFILFGGGTRESRYIVWRKDEDVKTWWDVGPGIETEESLSLALAGATGVSGGSAHTIPALLLPDEVGGRSLTDLTDTKRLEDAKLGEVECFRIEGKYAGSPMTLWIEKNTCLVRRIDEQSQFEHFRTEDTTTYQPVLDAEIPQEMLEFNPPTQK